jgi:peptidoglycan DL-endopeptidase CwlO
MYKKVILFTLPLIILFCLCGSAEAADFSSLSTAARSIEQVHTSDHDIQASNLSSLKVSYDTKQEEIAAQKEAEAAAEQAAIDAENARVAAIRQAKIDSIDAYLAGSPLAGYGEDFYEAAEAYGIDYRLLPAISCIESSKGAYCYRSHNAWGWSGGSWDSWSDAIWDMAAGIARVYGDESPQAMSAKYCTSNASWGEEVASEMSKM